MSETSLGAQAQVAPGPLAPLPLAALPLATDACGVPHHGDVAPGAGFAASAGAAAARRLALPRHLAAVLAFGASTLLLMMPAWLNGFPFLFWDTGGYLAAATSGELMPGRSTIYGLFLLAGHFGHFWPVVAVQTALCVWVVMLALRAHGLGHQPLTLLGTSAVLALFTALPFVSGQLMPDVFAGVGLCALYLLIWKRSALGRSETLGLAVLAAVSGACHSSVLAAQVLVLLAALIGTRLLRHLTGPISPRIPVLALLAGFLLTPAVNLIAVGQFALTPGGTAFVFGRMLEDGMVTRYLAEHCPDPDQPLCPYRTELPTAANDFLWDDHVALTAIGGMVAGAPAMRAVILGSLASEPLRNAALALRAAFRQTVTLATGDDLLSYLFHTQGIVKAAAPASYPAMMRATQQSTGGLDFGPVNALHVPVAIGACLMLAAIALWSALAGRADIFVLSAGFLTLIVANAAVCGILSNPHDRYQARIAWLAVFALTMLALNGAAAFRRRWQERP